MRIPTIVLVAAAFACGCISSAPIVPVTPANQAQVQSCQQTAGLHNDVVIADMVLGAGSTATGAVAAAVSDTNTKTALAVAAAITAGLTAAGGGIAGLTAANFTNSQCGNVVGQLAGKTGRLDILPRMSELPEAR